MTPIPLRILLEDGRWGEVAAVVTASGKCPAKEFLEQDLDQLVVSKGPPVSTARERCHGYFFEMAEYGRMSRKRFKAEMNGFSAFSFEIKNKQVRFPCFRDGNCWIITHGFFKPGAKKKLGEWPQEHVTRANNLRTEYKSRKTSQQKG
jgi:hypothetical protein